MHRDHSKDFSKYLRVPYRDKGRDMAGWDCFGLYRFVLFERLGIMLTSYVEQQDYCSSTNHAAVAEFIAMVRPVGWLGVPEEEAREGDGVVFAIGGVPWHCGYVIERGRMLHAHKNCGTVIEPYTNHTWARRLEGVFRCKL